MKNILVIGIGAGDPEYVTIQAVKALNKVDVFFILDKGESKHKLIELRREICERYIDTKNYRFAEAVTPERVRGVADYQASVNDLNREKQDVYERLITDELEDGECGAFLVWGDPSLYDSTIRILGDILDSGRAVFEFEVIPGITSVQALTARHKIPLNRIGRSVEITTGRKLANGLSANADTTVVMLDAEMAFKAIDNQDMDIYWGAYIGTPDEILVSGKLKDVAENIEHARRNAREKNGWIMDTYLLRESDESKT
ncbi:MAG: precorrin-6A synthase (deacetylating) [Spongiibacteraceae bacterium]